MSSGEIGDLQDHQVLVLSSGPVEKVLNACKKANCNCSAPSAGNWHTTHTIEMQEAETNKLMLR